MSGSVGQRKHQGPWAKNSGQDKKSTGYRKVFFAHELSKRRCTLPRPHTPWLLYLSQYTSLLIIFPSESSPFPSPLIHACFGTQVLLALAFFTCLANLTSLSFKSVSSLHPEKVLRTHSALFVTILYGDGTLPCALALLDHVVLTKQRLFLVVLKPSTHPAEHPAGST